MIKPSKELPNTLLVNGVVWKYKPSRQGLTIKNDPLPVYHYKKNSIEICVFLFVVNSWGIEINEEYPYSGKVTGFKTPEEAAFKALKYLKKQKENIEKVLDEHKIA